MIKDIARQDATSFKQALAERHSCRGYLPDQVPDTVIREILELAQQSASWCNSQPWQVTITTGAGTDRFRDALYAHAAGNPPATPDLAFPERYVGVYKERQRECGWALYSAVGIGQGDREASGRQALENFRFFGAPHVAIVTSERELGTYGVLDCGGYVSNFMLAAATLGVASIAQAALAMHGQLVRQHFGIAENRTIVCGISFGYADKQHPANGFRTTRANIDDVATWVRD